MIRIWRLDYDWSKRGGRWTEDSDVLLEGRLYGEPEAHAALRDWVEAQEAEPMAVDGVLKRVFYRGGVLGYCAPPSPDAEGEARHEEGCSAVYLHSHGQDAFDSLHEATQVVAAAVRRSGAARALRWIEHRHDRANHRLSWPG